MIQKTAATPFADNQHSFRQNWLPLAYCRSLIFCDKRFLAVRNTSFSTSSRAADSADFYFDRFPKRRFVATPGASLIGFRGAILRRACLLIAMFLCGSVSTGCATARFMMVRQPADPLAEAPRLHSSNRHSLDDVVAHLNRNSDRIQSWKTNQVKIHAKGVSIPLSGRFAVERGQHVRLVVSSPRGPEVDIGSNDERFWLWSKENRPSIVTCKHENTETVRQSIGIPFEPDWLMQVLYVAPIPTSGVEFMTPPTNDEMRLVQQIVTAHGLSLRRVVHVDLKRGGMVTEHSVHDYNGTRIAIAKLSRHRYDKKTGVILAHRIELDWPQNGMGVTLELGAIEINPRSIPKEIWSMPEFPESEIVNLDENVERFASRSEGVVRLSTIEGIPPEQETLEDDESPLSRYVPLDGEMPFDGEIPVDRQTPIENDEEASDEALESAPNTSESAGYSKVDNKRDKPGKIKFSDDDFVK